MSIVEEIAEFTMKTQATIHQLIQERDEARAIASKYDAENRILKEQLTAVRNTDKSKLNVVAAKEAE